MHLNKISMVFASLVLAVSPKAGAGLYNITFDDGNGNIGSGQIDVETANNNCSACAGYLNVTAGEAAGEWTLYTAAGSTSYPGYMLSPAGAYWYNNAVYPSGNNPQYSGSGSLLDVYGLLFTQNNGNELNLWGNADGGYTLGGSVGGWQNFNVDINFQGAAITPIPEASTVIACGFLLLPIGASAFRSMRKHQLPQP